MLGLVLMLNTACDTLQGKPLVQMESRKKVNEDCLLNNLAEKALDLVMKRLYVCFLLSYCRVFLGCTTVVVSKTQVLLILVLQRWIYFTV